MADNTLVTPCTLCQVEVTDHHLIQRKLLRSSRRTEVLAAGTLMHPVRAYRVLCHALQLCRSVGPLTALWSPI